MISKVRPSFWRACERLAPSTKARARQAYQLFAANPDHPSLRFKKLHGNGEIWSVRINEQYRAVGVRSGDTIEWIWVGSHNEFDNRFVSMNIVTANGQPVTANLPCTLEGFLVAQKLLPRSVVVEHNGEAVAPSEFSVRQLKPGDKLEIVKIVAGG